jgi:hypothetical protein
LREKFIPELKGKELVNGGKGSNKMFFEGCNGLFGGIDIMTVWQDKLNVDLACFDVLFYRRRTFIVHHIQCRVISLGTESCNDFNECCDHGCVSSSGHGMDNDGIQIIHIQNKHILHVFEELDGEGTGEIGVHGTCIGIGQCRKAKHILHGACFMGWEHLIHFSTGGYNVGLHISCQCGIGSVLAHMSFVCVS